MRSIIGYLSSVLIFCACLAHAELPHGAPIPADEAFLLQVQLVDKNSLEFNWQIAPGYHIYQDQLQILNSKNIELLNPQNMPHGTKVDDPVLGPSVEYENELTIKLPLNEAITNELLLHYQGCSAAGFCYEPVFKLIRMHGLQQPEVTTTELLEFPEESKVDSLAAEIKTAFLPVTLAIFFGLGILLAFSPCVLPMIPLVVNLIVGNKKISTHKAVVLASSYVLGMAGSYAIAGTLIGMLGAQLQSWIQTPAILISFSVILILLALSQLELIRIKVPTFNRRLHHWGQQQLQGSIPGAFVLGIISSLIVSPCITPPLIGVLTYIGQNGNPFVGGLTLFALGLGMGAPLILVAMLSSVILPKAGRWMNLIKVGTAVALLAMAIWILQRFVEQTLSLALWAGLCIIFAIYLRKGDKLLKTFAGILILIATSLITIAFMNCYNKCHIESNIVAPTTESTWHNIQSAADLDKYLGLAKQKNLHTMLDVTATWCTSCKRIELGVFPDPAVQQQLKHLMLLRIDVSHVSDAENQLLNNLHVYGPPAILFFNPDGQELENKRLIGAVSVQDLLGALQF